MLFYCHKRARGAEQHEEVKRGREDKEERDKQDVHVQIVQQPNGCAGLAKLAERDLDPFYST